MSRKTANFLLLFAGLIWGGGFVAQQTAMDDIGPFLFMTLRFLLAALAILPMAIWEAKKRQSAQIETPTQWRSIILVGVVFFFAMALQQVGIMSTTVTNAGILTGLYVVLVPVILVLFWRTRQPFIIWPCAVLAFVGIWLLGDGGFSALTIGDWIVIVSAIFAALHVILLGKTVVDNRRPAALVCVQFAVSALMALAGFVVAQLVMWSAEPMVEYSTLLQAMPEILYSSFIAGAAAFIIMAICQQYTAPADAAILLSSEALFAALGGALFLSERLTPLGYLGCAMLFTSIAIISVKSAEQS